MSIGTESAWVDLMGKDIRFRRVSSAAESDSPMAEVGTIVKCNLTGYFYSIAQEKRLNNEPFEVLKDQYFQVGESDAIPGLELPLRHSRVGDRLQCLMSARFAFGSSGRCLLDTHKRNPPSNTSQEESDDEKDDFKMISFVEIVKRNNIAIVPKNMDLEYDIEVTAHYNDRALHPDTILSHQQELDTIGEDEEQRQKLLQRLLTVQSMNYRKEAGNRWFSFDEFSRAAKAYSQATRQAETYFNTSSTSTQPAPSAEDGGDELTQKIKAIEQQEQAKNALIAEEDIEIVGVYVTCLNNLAACKLSLGEFAAAKELCVKVLSFSPANAKALLRAAKATLALDSFEECELCLKRLLSIEDLTEHMRTAAQLEVAKLRKAQARYKAKAKEIQQRIADKLFNKSAKTTTADVSTDVTAGAVKSATDAAIGVETAPKSSPSNNECAESTIPTHGDRKAAAHGGNNMLLLMGTSLLVVVISIIVAYLSN